MASSAPDRRRVYITCRPIFTGDNALLRREKKIRNLVRKNKLSLTKLLSELGEDKLVAVLKGLLEENVFVSEVCARAIFPDLFQTTPSRNAEREVSEAKAAKSAAKAVEEVVASEDNLKELSDEEPEPGVLQFASASAPFPVPTLGRYYFLTPTKHTRIVLTSHSLQPQPQQQQQEQQLLRPRLQQH